jgi:hypothetical protein
VMTMWRPLLLAPAVALAVAAAACGHKIGDSCSQGSDCAQDGTRICDITSPDGYCTQVGCNFGGCPDEAVCVRFYPGLNSDRACDPINPGDACGIDMVCTVAGLCAPRSIEQRYCMLKCDGDGDCRDGYECRTLEVMQLHGGEPVPDPEATTSEPLEIPFCAPAVQCLNDTQCTDPGYTCVERSCVRQ